MCSNNIVPAKGLHHSLPFILLIISCAFLFLGSNKIDLLPKALGPNSLSPWKITTGFWSNKNFIALFISLFTFNKALSPSVFLVLIPKVSFNDSVRLQVFHGRSHYLCLLENDWIVLFEVHIKRSILFILSKLILSLLSDHSLYPLLSQRTDQQFTQLLILNTLHQF